MDTASFLALALACAPSVHSGTALALAQVESSLNPHAIGVVGGQLERQPRTRAEATATRATAQGRWMELQRRPGADQPAQPAAARLDRRRAFDPCSNLQSMQVVLVDCFERASAATVIRNRQLRRALSCYYSGNFKTGFDHGYVGRVEKRSHTVASDPRPPP
jgi:type IV secretion system protein VirB1